MFRLNFLLVCVCLCELHHEVGCFLFGIEVEVQTTLYMYTLC